MIGRISPIAPSNAPTAGAAAENAGASSIAAFTRPSNILFTPSAMAGFRRAWAMPSSRMLTTAPAFSIDREIVGASCSNAPASEDKPGVRFSMPANAPSNTVVNAPCIRGPFTALLIASNAAAKPCRPPPPAASAALATPLMMPATSTRIPPNSFAFVMPRSIISLMRSVS